MIPKLLCPKCNSEKLAPQLTPTEEHIFCSQCFYVLTEDDIKVQWNKTALAFDIAMALDAN